jgi:acyl-CoA thioester hydrolase
MRQCTTTVRVRYKDTDQMGVVYYSNYMVWFEVARAELFRKIGHPYKEMEQKLGLRLMVIEAYCRYMLPARYDDLVRVGCRLTDVRNSSIVFEYTVKREGEILAKGKTAHVFCDPAGRPKRIPQDLREALR